MAKVKVFYSDFPELAGFESQDANEILKAEESILKRRETEKTSGETRAKSKSALEAIAKFGNFPGMAKERMDMANDVAPSEEEAKSAYAKYSEYRFNPEFNADEENAKIEAGDSGSWGDTPSSRMMKPTVLKGPSLGSLAYATLPKDQLAKLAEGQILKEQGYDQPEKQPMRVAREFGLTASTAPEAKNFVSSLKTEMPSASSQRKSDQDKMREQIAAYNALPDGPEKDQALNDMMLLKNSALSNTGILQATKKQEAMLPGETKKAARTKAASTAAGIQTESQYADVSADTDAKKTAATTQAKIGAERGSKILSESAAASMGDVMASMSQLDALLVGMKNPNAPQGPIAQIRKNNPYDWEAKSKQQLIASTKQLVGKALEGGVLRAEDEVKYDKILPTMADTKESALKKAEQLKSMLNIAYQARRESLKRAGYDVEGFEPSINNGAPKDDFDSLWGN